MSRLGNLLNGPYANPVKIWINQAKQYEPIIRKACDFWTRYSGIRFELMTTNTVTDPYIIINAKFDETPAYAAITRRTGDIYEVNGVITLYAGWLRSSEEWKWLIIAHELGHVLIIERGHTTNGSFMDAPATPLFHSYMQKAVKILYSKNPGDPL